MLDRSIPFYNLILRCDDYKTKEVVLPSGFSIVTYQKGYEKAWAKLEYSIGDFASVKEAEEYFIDKYLKDNSKLENILFLINEDKDVIGSCIAWQDLRNSKVVSSLHWLVLDEQYQDLGLGKVLCIAVMNIYAKNNSLPVYIHTQPYSYKAICLYVSLGFKIQKEDTFSSYVNEYSFAIETLKQILPKGRFYQLIKY